MYLVKNRQDLDFNKKIEEKEYSDLIDGILPFLPYGDFSQEIVKMLIHDEPINKDYSIEKITHCFNILVILGFAFIRHDLKYTHNDKKIYYIELTEQGRLLKGCGSIFEFNKKEREKQQEIQVEKDYRQQERLRNKYLFWITVCIACSSAFQGFWNLLEMSRNYYNGSLNQIRTNVVPFLLCIFIIGIFYIILKQLLYKRKK